jgi:hypothetical protein
MEAWDQAWLTFSPRTFHMKRPRSSHSGWGDGAGPTTLATGILQRQDESQNAHRTR